MFEKIVIANRGEIACRIIQTCQRLGVRTVAIYSEADEKALHVEMADEAYLVGPAPASGSYLQGDRIISIARSCGAGGIHPGFGFLSENAAFARKCTEAGIVFIGPPAEAIQSMGSKRQAKELMQEAGVPVVPGFKGTGKSDETLLQEAANIGYPVLIKASAGGGGKGMRLVHDQEEFISGLQEARREAKASFGDDELIVEKYLQRPRHVEVQVFGDTHGNMLYLFERECSLQRRHQKIIEEAPAPGFPEEKRRKIGETAVAAARAVNYQNAGTVEFIVDQDNTFYFMEMNTRLQVEHPVTEMITGVDLVEWQMRIAGGEELPVKQEQLRINGHSIECRLYAEDPENSFFPTTGKIRRYRLPSQGVHIRVDTGVREGDEISTHYDPMIAKLIVWDTTRNGALRRMKKALFDYRIAGLTTNLNFLASLISNQHFKAGTVDTELVERLKEELLVERKQATKQALSLAALYVLLNRKAVSKERGRHSSDPWSPWHLNTGWRLNERYSHQLTLLDWSREITLMVHFRSDGYFIEFQDYCVEIDGELSDSGDLVANIGGARVTGSVVENGHEITVVCSDGTFRLLVQDPVYFEDDEAAGGNTVNSSMPGLITNILVNEGDVVERGQKLLILEAMKMEHTLTAHVTGTVKSINCEVGSQVSEDSVLVELELSDE